MTQYNGLYKFRRVLSVVLALAVLLLALPAFSLPAAAETAEPEHDHSSWTPWTSDEYLPKTAGAYYLTKDVSAYDELYWSAPPGETNLCLNGKTIKDYRITVPKGATLNIYGEGGKIEVDDTSDPAIGVRGTCRINQVDISNSGSAVEVYFDDTPNVYINGGNFKSTGNSTIKFIGRVYTKGSLYINGGATITCKNYPAIHALRGNVTIDNATVSADVDAVSVDLYSNLNINGGSFSSNKGNAITVNGSTPNADLNITGGSFTAKKYAVYADSGVNSFKLSGSPTFEGGSADICLYGSRKITITDTLSNTIPYSVATMEIVSKSSPVVFTDSSTTSNNDETKFTAADSKYIVRKNSAGQLELAIPETYTVTFDYDGADGGNTTEEMVVANGSAYGELPTPTKTGYIFKGWYKDNTKVDKTTKVTSNHTLKAKWEECGHINAQWTDNNDGLTHSKECNDCRATETKPHNFGAWSPDDDGKTHSKKCDDCEAALTKDHNWTVTSRIEPTETEAGKEISTCDDCGEEKTKELPATGSTSGGNNNGGGTTQQPSETTTPSTGDNTPSTGDTTEPSTGDTSDPGDTTEPSTGDSTEPSDENGAGNITVNSESGENAPSVTISEEASAKLKEEIIAEHLTDEEKAAVANGDTLDVILVVEDAGDTVPAEDKQVTEAVLTDTEYTVGMYLNVDLIKLINGVEVGRITELNTPIRVTIEIPEELRSANRAFAIVRVHNGTAEILKDVDDDPDTITILTDRFSTYSLAYQDTEGSNPDTGATTPIAITGLACAVIIAAVAVKRKKIIE